MTATPSKNTPASPPSSSAAQASPSYERKKRAARARSAAQVVAGQDIGAIPPPRNLARRLACHTDFRLFCDSYFPNLFNLAWSDDHLRVIAKIERTVIHTETFAVAMPRGAGKTTLCMIAVLWAILEGYHPFVMLIGNAAEHATAMLDNLKSILSSNEELLADYPEAVYPIRALEGETRRAGGQRYYGVRTHIGWDADQVIMPSIPGSKCSGAILRTAGILGNIRGANFVRPDGTSVRPSLVVIDDPQTDESARSPSQVRKRLSIINGTVAGLAGPGRKIARIIPCTVIEEGDVADTILNREKNPEWQGERTKLIYQLPTDEKLWNEYANIRATDFRNGGSGATATAFYVAHRAEMDAGAVVAWAARKNVDEVSAIQNAMNLKIRDLRAFYSEYQNDPLPSDEAAGQRITIDDITSKLNGLARSFVPAEAGLLTAFIDVQGSILFYMVCAWESDFSGYVVEYGSYPDQKRPYFTLRDAKRTLQIVHKGMGLEARIYAGLVALTNSLLGRAWQQDGGAELRIGRCLVDANWGDSTDIVYQFCRQTSHGGIMMPSHGVSITAAKRPMAQYERKKGELLGFHWYIPLPGSRRLRHVLIDTNFYKSFSHTRIAAAIGDPGCLSFYTPAAGADHQMVAEHILSEYGIETSGQGRKLLEWKEKPGKPDNHLFDCLVGCCVGASMQGIQLGVINPSSPATSPTKPAAGKPKRKKVFYM